MSYLAAVSEPRFTARFDGREVFAALPPDVQLTVGAAALEWIMAGIIPDRCRAEALTAAAFNSLGAAEVLAQELITEAAWDAITAALDIEQEDAKSGGGVYGPARVETAPIPAIVGPVCSACGGLLDGRVADAVAVELAWQAEREEACAACTPPPPPEPPAQGELGL